MAIKNNFIQMGFQLHPLHHIFFAYYNMKQRFKMSVTESRHKIGDGTINSNFLIQTNILA